MTQGADVRTELAELSAKLDKLLSDHARLARENETLRQAHDSLSRERAALLAKNEQARSRVEAMITRLKALEQHG
jgi:cell division protein ZapB